MSDTAIEVLRCSEIPNKSDTISRQAAINAIGKTSDELYENIKKGATFPQRQWFDGMAQAQSILENLPSAQPEILACGEGELNVPDTNVGDTISRKAAIDLFPNDALEWDTKGGYIAPHLARRMIEELPAVQPETCEGCKHLGKWENEVEYGYPSPCTRCRRRAEDHYER